MFLIFICTYKSKKTINGLWFIYFCVFIFLSNHKEVQEKVISRFQIV